MEVISQWIVDIKNIIIWRRNFRFCFRRQGFKRL